MKPYQFIQVEIKEAVATIFLNRPEVKNAFHDGMIKEIVQAFHRLEIDKKVRVIVLRGNGSVFCAGADLNWMLNAGKFSIEQNLNDSLQLANCFKTIYHCKTPTIAFVHGLAMGGGIGLLSACDFAIAETQTFFSLSEVKLGLVPATISPYVIKRIGEFAAKDVMLTGRRFNALEAHSLKLINKVVDADRLEEELGQTIKQLLTSGPEALSICKEMIGQLANEWSFKESIEKTAQLICKIRATNEAQEGINAFLEKRKPNWIIQ